METTKIVGLNTKWYRYQLGITQEQLSDITNYKTAYISVIETGDSNLTINTIDIISKALNVKPKQLFDEDTTNKAIDLPTRVDMYARNK